jgi:hypothetical protein
MPSYHFDLRYDEEPWSHDSLPFDDPAQARAAALTLATAVAREDARFGRRIQVRLRDHNPDPIATVTLSITVEPPM